MILSTPTSPKPPSPLKVLLIGPPGARKTTLTLQFPSVHILVCGSLLDGPEKQLRATFAPNLTYSYDNISRDSKNLPRQADECFDTLIDKVKTIRDDKDYASIKWLVVDDMTHLNEWMVRKTLKAQKREVMEGRDWGPFTSYGYNLLVSRLEETGKNVICIAHDQAITKSDDKDMMKKITVGYEPYFQGRIGDNLPALFTDYWRLEVIPATAGRYENKLFTQPTNMVRDLKNSLGMPAELDVTKGFSVIEPYLKGRM